MEMLDFDNLEPNRTGITVDGRTMTVQGYDILNGIQIFYDQEENEVNRVRGIDMPDREHYLVNEDDLDYLRRIPGYPDASATRRVYIVTDYDPEKSIITGQEISHNQAPQLLDDICIALYKRAMDKNN